MAELFHWHSSLLENYSRGDLIAVAETADEARDKLRAAFDGWVKEHRDWVLFIYTDPEDIEEYGVPALRRKLEADLAAEPEVHQVMFINGSE